MAYSKEIMTRDGSLLTEKAKAKGRIVMRSFLRGDRFNIRAMADYLMHQHQIPMTLFKEITVSKAMKKFMKDVRAPIMLLDAMVEVLLNALYAKEKDETLLKKWGVKFNATDEQLQARVDSLHKFRKLLQTFKRRPRVSVNGVWLNFQQRVEYAAANKAAGFGWDHYSMAQFETSLTDVDLAIESAQEPGLLQLIEQLKPKSQPKADSKIAYAAQANVAKIQKKLEALEARLRRSEKVGADRARDKRRNDRRGQPGDRKRRISPQRDSKQRNDSRVTPNDMPQGTPPREKTQQCRDWEMDRCKRPAASCWFRHFCKHCGRNNHKSAQCPRLH